MYGMDWNQYRFKKHRHGEYSDTKKIPSWDKFFLSSDQKKDKLPGYNVKLENQIVLIRYTYYLLPSDFFCTRL